MSLKKNSKNLFLVGASVILLSLTGCKGEQKQETAQQPQQQEQASPHGGAPVAPAGDQTAQDINKAAHANIKTQKEVKLSEEVKAKWKEVKMELTDPATKSAEVLTLKVGNAVALKRPGFKLKVEAFVPDYAISDNHIESRSNEPKNPAVLVELMDGDKSVAKGWVFKDFPEFNSYTDDRFPLKLVAPGVAPASAKK
ncbi:MAG: hypothetical protein HZA14_12575 [Nitrospirae bacterium]|nr:hypothetical protein [Nitrospirota bacterium]